MTPETITQSGVPGRLAVSRSGVAFDLTYRGVWARRDRCNPESNPSEAEAHIKSAQASFADTSTATTIPTEKSFVR
jgi:hypothetical protein